MEYIVSFLAFLLFIYFVVYLFLYFVRFLDMNVQKIKKKLKIKSDIHKNEQARQKLKFLNSITGIHSASSALSLKRYVIDFYKCVTYHKDYKLSFYDRDLSKLEISIEKYIKYKLYKIYGIDENRDALINYKMFLQNK